jgi:hypothetical protein
MLRSGRHNTAQDQNRKRANRSFESVAQFKYLGTKQTNKNLIHEEFKRILN